MNFLDKLETLMSIHGIKNKKQLASQSGIPYTTIVNWYKRGYENMTISNFKILCDFFGVTMDSMVRNEVTELEYYNPKNNKIYLSAEEELLIKCYRAADDLDKNLALRSVNADQAEDMKKEDKNAG